ncbi:MAG: histidine kinase [Saprospiraceae bacterium]|nr:histidine kinase [Saprospiraceae bacterium]
MTTAATKPIPIKQLEKKLAKEPNPARRMELLDKITGHYIYTHTERALEYLSELEQLLQQWPQIDVQLNYHYHRAVVENQLYHFQEAAQHCLDALILAEEQGDTFRRAELYIDFAGIQMNLNRFTDAADWLDKAQKLLRQWPEERLSSRYKCREGFLQLHYGDLGAATELLLDADKSILRLSQLQLKDHFFLSLIYSGLGTVYERSGDMERSVEAYRKVVKTCEATGIQARMDWHYLNLGAGLMALSEYEEAESFFEKVLQSGSQAGASARAGALGNLGYCRFRRKRFDEALDLFQQAEDLFKTKPADDAAYNFSIIEGWRGRLYAETGQTRKAKEHFAKAVEFARQNEDYKQISSICRDVAAFYAARRDFKNAYEFQLIYDQMAERYREQINQQRLMELEVRYEAEKKKQEAEMLKLQASKLQLKALRAQMNPHFMYNALNAIQHFITANETASASKYLARFAQLMRRSLEYSDLEFIALEKEIEFLEDYLFLNEKLRFEGRLQYRISVDDDIEEDISGVPAMIVQPYVENALEHGLRIREHGTVEVRFSLFDEDTLLCTVEDNGIGREKARQMQKASGYFNDHRSRGTSITRKRLQLLHQSKHNKGIFVRIIDLHNETTGEATGTRVEIIIPIREISGRGGE